jgi:hypothetical protein
MFALIVGLALAGKPANTSASAGSLTIEGQTGWAIHTHGGEAARLRTARFSVRNRGKKAATVSVERVSFLTGHTCDEAPAERRSEPTFVGLRSGEKSSTPALAVPPRSKVAFTVEFSPVEAYYSWCDRFAFEVAFRIGDEQVVVVAETEVQRED